MPETPASAEEFTIDELAARAGMTVRNVRAYAGRGLIDAPRLEGRTGYYSAQHLPPLRLIREFLDRGYTLAAVEKAVLSSPVSAAGPALDLLALLEQPHRDVVPEVVSRDALAAMAGVTRDDGLIEAMVEFGLAEWVAEDPDAVRLLHPTVVRNGAAAVALGLPAESVIALFPVISANLRQVADAFVSEVVRVIVQPFLDAGLPEDQWPALLTAVENLLTVAGQVTYGIFRHELASAIDAEVGSQIGHFGG